MCSKGKIRPRENFHKRDVIEKHVCYDEASFADILSIGEEIVSVRGLSSVTAPVSVAAVIRYGASCYYAIGDDRDVLKAYKDIHH